MKGGDWQNKYLEITEEFIKPYKKDPNVVGITLNGGVSRGTGDEFSEIDIHFFVKNEQKKNLPPKWPGTGNDIGINGVWFDIYLANYKEYLKKDLGMAERWDLANSKILFDRGNKIKNLITKKAKWKKGEREELLEGDLGSSKFWCFSLARTFISRGDLINAHMLLNESLNLFVDYYFVSSNEFIPHFKWKYYYFQKLKQPSDKIKKTILKAYLIKEFSLKDLKRRFSIMKGILIRNIHEPLAKQNRKAINRFKQNLKEGIFFHHPFDNNKKKKFE